MGNSIKLHIFSYCMTGMIRPETSGILTGGPEKTSQKGKNAVIIEVIFLIFMQKHSQRSCHPPETQEKRKKKSVIQMFSRFSLWQHLNSSTLKAFPEPVQGPHHTLKQDEIY